MALLSGVHHVREVMPALNDMAGVGTLGIRW
jgi:hypothetical protein